MVKTLHRSNKRTQTFESDSSCSSCGRSANQSSSEPVWIRAELDDPYDHDSGENFTVLAFDQKMRGIGVRDRHEFKSMNLVIRELYIVLTSSRSSDSQYVVYSRLPSRLRSNIYVFRENSAISKGRSTRRFRVSTRNETPNGYIGYCEIPLKRLGMKSRLMIWLGRVEWLFILPDPRSRYASFEQEKVPETC